MINVNKPQDEDDPVVPEGPTQPQNLRSPISEPDSGDTMKPAGPPTANPPSATRYPKSKNPGGRKPWDELAEEHRLLQEEVGALRKVARVLADLPAHVSASPDYVEYTMTRDGRTAKITAGDIALARQLLGRP